MRSYGMTHVGRRRKINQDYIFYTDGPMGSLPNLYIVADGMGGHKAGDKASTFAVEKFKELAADFYAEQPFYFLKEILAKVNRDLAWLSRQRKEYEGMGTTFVAATVVENQLYVVNVGDSRLYLMSGGIVQITRDHSLVEELVRNGQLTREEARIHPQKNMITKALGVDDFVEPDFFQVDLKPRDRILLCSDGLSNMVEDGEIGSILSQEESPQKAVARLISRANEQGGLDNIAAVVAEKEEER